MINAKIKISSRVGNLSGRLINYCFRPENTTDECSSGAICKHFANTFLPHLCLLMVTKMQCHTFLYARLQQRWNLSNTSKTTDPQLINILKEEEINQQSSPCASQWFSFSLLRLRSLLVIQTSAASVRTSSSSASAEERSTRRTHRRRGATHRDLEGREGELTGSAGRCVSPQSEVSQVLPPRERERSHILFDAQRAVAKLAHIAKCIKLNKGRD